MTPQTVFWLSLAIVLGLIEASTSNLITLWPAISAVFTAIFAALGLDNMWLSVIFVSVSAILLICTRPLVKRFVTKKAVATNADRIIGADGIVICRIDPVENTGQVKILGQIWSAKARTNSIIEENAKVTVVALEGVKAVVEAKDI